MIKIISLKLSILSMCQKKDGKFIGHNNSKRFKLYNSITELVHDGNSQAIYLTGIKKK